jgi:import inner membrane translocase subunit TIM23
VGFPKRVEAGNRRGEFSTQSRVKPPSQLIPVCVQKEKSFYARIKRYRADASASSPQNPIPDYYGEKIGSVKDYRRWLKDQKAFNLKKNKNMI